MIYAGCDLHKQSITVCLVDAARNVLARKTLPCRDEQAILTFFEQAAGADPEGLQIVVEATAGYEWFLNLVEPHARRVLLAHPGKLRVIAESTRKSDRLDAQVLAEFLAADMIPTSYRPTPRQREHRRLVRQRDRVRRRLASVKVRIRRLLSDHNADLPSLFNLEGLAWLRELAGEKGSGGERRRDRAGSRLSASDRFCLRQFLAEFDFGSEQLAQAEAQLRTFAQAGPAVERERRELLRSIPGVGFVTAEVVLAEIADVWRFGSQKQVVAYAGLAPGQRESGGRSKELHIEKNGSKLLRWVVVEAAWQLVRHSQRWNGIYTRLKTRLKAKKAIVAVARRLLCLITAILKTGRPYSAAYAPGVG